MSEDELVVRLRLEGVRTALDALPEMERDVLESRFGLRGEPMTVEQIGDTFGLCEDCVLSLEGRALARLAALRDMIRIASQEEG